MACCVYLRRLRNNTIFLLTPPKPKLGCGGFFMQHNMTYKPNNIINMATLNIGDLFQQAWKDCTKPMFFEVLDIDREKNSLKVKCTSFEGHSHEETWDDLDITETSIDTGEYKLMTHKQYEIYSYLNNCYWL